ncbi:MAG: hypothetical protein M3Y81_22255 [Chloroflexota bacterium]|nr:hypothetical protein [Chloroflexota bacterium]
MVFPPHKSKNASDDPSEHRVSQATAGKTAHRSVRRWNTFASVLVVSLLAITSLLLFRHYSSAIVSTIPTGKPIGAPVSMPVLAHTEVNGLETTLSITPGPYFLSELLPVAITLTNHSQHSLMLGGAPALNTCNGAFSATITGGKEPHYDLPGNNFAMSCPGGMSELDMNKSLSVHGYIPLTRSSTVAITIEARVFTITQNQNGTINTQGSSPLDEHWPSIAIIVAPQIPSDRQLSLQAQGNNVIVNAPGSVRPHLVYFYTVNCSHGSGTNDGWDPLKTTILQEPYCDDLIRQWIYAVSAPGYAIAAISMGF